jgi:hypothetical protein
MAQQVAQELVESARGFGFEIRDPQRFAQNMARLVEETGKAVTAFVEPRVSNPAQPLARGGDFTHIMNALSQIQQAWLFQPQKLMAAQAELWQRYWQLWTSALAILTSGGTAGFDCWLCYFRYFSRTARVLSSPNPPPVHTASVVGWKKGETPSVASDLRIEALATGLEHPRSLYVLWRVAAR